MQFQDLPRGIPGSPASHDSAPRALWVDPETIKANRGWRYEMDKVFLGALDKQLIGLKDDRHLLTIAGSRAGKGISAIVPNLLLYTGSVLVIDPKRRECTFDSRAAR
ncbi:hypothetical protein D1821_06055 [Phaeobacter inhibens]|uniref:type IV secretory system conjugative DNA transfer family protein n=1 Tax=Phaeobacter inhibens TaxID=221822 RepID=UPI000E522D47|nr:type IV secretory system conjugative DNA transfer family protein [Phaeobacter inhibens]AXT41984.1 hypothetical protein D1821_06055 [Phaeobacter inhibens]